MKHIVLATRAPIAVQPHHLRACRPRVIERGRNDRRERHCWLVAALAAVLHLAVQSQAAIASGRIEPRREVVSPIDSAALDARRSGPLGNHDTAGAAAAGDARSNVDDEVDLAEPPETPLDPDGVHLRIGTFVPERSSSLHRPGQGALPRPGWFVIQLEGPVDPTKRASLASRGVVLRSYLPSNAFIVRLTSGFDAPTRLGDLDFVRWIGPFQDDWKVSPELGQREFATAERQKLAAAGWNRLTVTTFDATNLGADLAALGALPGLGIASWAPVDPGAPRDGAPDADSAPPQGVIEVVAPRGIEAMIAALDGVQWIEDAPEATLRNSSNKWIVQSNVPESAIVWSKGIRGDGQIGGLIDGGVKKTHCSFKDPEGDPPGPNHRKLAAYFGSSTADEHGTHVAGTFAGDEQPISGSTTLRGMAYRARIAFTNLATITSTNLAAKLKQNHDAGARVHSNSWGDDGTNSYTSWSHDIDLFSWDNQDDLVLFAVTNLDTTVRNPENAKNCLAVAASQDAPNQSAHCSGGHGNTKDGRRKPEVFAPGCDTLSSDSSTTCGFVGLTGTSMA
ncbi:MAG: S8 family serine peptidase, partial [Phycisphaerales bacterium]